MHSQLKRRAPRESDIGYDIHDLTRVFGLILISFRPATSSYLLRSLSYLRLSLPASDGFQLLLISKIFLQALAGEYFQ